MIGPILIPRTTRRALLFLFPTFPPSFFSSSFFSLFFLRLLVDFVTSGLPPSNNSVWRRNPGSVYFLYFGKVYLLGDTHNSLSKNTRKRREFGSWSLAAGTLGGGGPVLPETRRSSRRHGNDRSCAQCAAECHCRKLLLFEAVTECAFACQQGR